jgi:hypothetical protein
MTTAWNSPASCLLPALSVHARFVATVMLATGWPPCVLRSSGPGRLALACVAHQTQALLLLVYRKGFDRRQVSDTTGVGVRAPTYKLPAARQALASILDRLDLL